MCVSPATNGQFRARLTPWQRTSGNSLMSQQEMIKTPASDRRGETYTVHTRRGEYFCSRWWWTAEFSSSCVSCCLSQFTFYRINYLSLWPTATPAKSQTSLIIARDNLKLLRGFFAFGAFRRFKYWFMIILVVLNDIKSILEWIGDFRAVLRWIFKVFLTIYWAWWAHFYDLILTMF